MYLCINNTQIYVYVYVKLTVYEVAAKHNC